VGFAIGGGGRYDELVGRFGRPMPACGVALDLERVHMAATAEERLDREAGRAREGVS
jgi:histidyl-tRNA synthetase